MSDEKPPPMTERERSIFAWVKAARTKGSGLPPSRALRWIDEMGDRLTAAEAGAPFGCGACPWAGADERALLIHVVEAHEFDPGTDGELAARMVAYGIEWRR